MISRGQSSTRNFHHVTAVPPHGVFSDVTLLAQNQPVPEWRQVASEFTFADESGKFMTLSRAGRLPRLTDPVNVLPAGGHGLRKRAEFSKVRDNRSRSIKCCESIDAVALAFKHMMKFRLPYL